MALAARPGPAAELLTLAEAASLAHVHRSTVRAWAAKGDLAAVRETGRREVRVRRGDLDRLLQRRRAAKPASSRRRSGSGLLLVEPTGTDALRRLASELSGSESLQPVFEEVLENSQRLFHADRLGLWLWHPTREHPLELVARRDFPDDIAQRVMAATGDSNLAGFEALRRQEVLVFRDAADPRVTPEMREVYAQNGIRSLCFVPAIYRGTPLALLVLYHGTPYEWSPEEEALARSFGDVQRGVLVAFVGSGGTVEIAVRDGSAARLLGVGVGAEVRA